MKTIYTIAEYRQLSEHDKLRAYLDERAAQTVNKAYIDTPLADIRALDATGLLRWHADIPNTMLRHSAGMRLLQAAHGAQALGWQLQVAELYRSLAKQRREFTEIRADMIAKHPDANEQEIWEMTTQFIADPDLAPPHCTGSAVDLQPIDAVTGLPVDMGTPLNSILEESHLMHSGISPQALRNRQLLCGIMMAAGFAPIATEWWHFSYGDAYWAAWYDTPALHDVIDA